MEYNSVLSTPIEAVLADTVISVKPKYRPIYRSISTSKSRLGHFEWNTWTITNSKSNHFQNLKILFCDKANHETIIISILRILRFTSVFLLLK